MDKSVLKAKQVGELREIAEALQLTGYKSLKKADLIDLIAAGGASGNGGDADSSSESAKSSDAEDAAAPDEVRDKNGMTSADRIRARRRGADAGDSDETSDEADAESPRRERQRTREDRNDRQEKSGGQQRSSGDERGGRDNRNAGDDGGKDDDQDGGRGQSRNRSRNRNKRNARNNDVNFDELEVRQGVLDLLPEGYGFLRTTGYTAGDRDVYVSQAFVRRNQLRRGDVLAGPIRYNKGNDKFPALARIDSVEGVAIDEDARPEPRVEFKDLTPVHPTERLVLETGPDSLLALRLVDLIAPIGKGQRSMLVTPPGAGGTTVLREVARAIEQNNPEVHLMVLLVDERPEEVSDFEEAIEGEVIASTFDRPAEDHTQVAELTLERAKRIVEYGKDVVVLVDSLTRLGRAHNLVGPSSGRTLAGGLDAGAVHPPKRLFGAARNVAEGGSLTIIAAAMVETGSATDEAIFEELAGKGNQQVSLLARADRAWTTPIVDVAASATRRDDLLFDEDEYATITKLRGALEDMDPAAAREVLVEKLAATKSNEQFLGMIAKSGLG